MPTPPRKRAPKKRALEAVPEPEEEVLPERNPERVRRDPNARPNGKGMNSPQAKWAAAGKPLGKNKQQLIDRATHNHGPDLAPGRYVPWLPKPEEVPPKPTEEPVMEYPGLGYMRSGHPEWQLLTIFHPDAIDMVARGELDKTVIERRWEIRWVPPDDRRCKARPIGKLARWMGNRCSSRAVIGGSVCKAHGGSLPTVRKAAQAALARAALPAAEKLIHIAITKRGVSDADRIKALIQILDRAGVEGRQTIELEVKPWQKVLANVYGQATGEGIGEDEGTEEVDYYLPDEDDEDEDDE